MRYFISKECFEKIYTYYKHVAQKYKHTYSKELMHKNIDDAIDGMYEIEKSLPRRIPVISQWKDYYMANTDKWYYAYMIDRETITVIDACHARNMHNA